VTGDIYSTRGKQPINTKYDDNQTLFRYKKLKHYIIAIGCCICGRETKGVFGEHGYMPAVINLS